MEKPMRKPLKTKHLLWILIAVSFGILLSFIATKSVGYEKIPNTPVVPAGVPFGNLIPGGQADGSFYFIKDSKKKPALAARAYYVGDLDTGEIILAKNESLVLPIASVSKLMTAAVSKEIQNQDELTTVSKNALATYGENGNFHLKEKIKVSDLIYPLLLESSNDAAEILAENSGRATFLTKMNTRSKELGLLNTSFRDPSGLSPENKSSALDLFKFSMYLKKNLPGILEISTLKSYQNRSHVWFSNNQFLGLPGYQGGKRGYTDQAQETAISLFTLPLGKEGLRNIGIVILHSPDRYRDVKTILNYLNKNVYYGGSADADLAWVKSKNGLPEEETPNYVSLVFGGDIMLDRGVESSAMKNFKGDFSVLFDNLSIFQKADIAFANLEGPASDRGADLHNLYSFRMNPSVIPALKGAGFNVLSVANNHMADWGRVAYTDTLFRLKENEIAYTGGGINKTEAEDPVIIEKNGIKIGYLGFSDVGPQMPAGADNPGLLLTNNPNFDQIIKNAAGRVDALVVSFHFGEEYKLKHNARQELLAHQAVTDGAKIVIGTHPHVAQDTEVYKGGFIAYSLGNLIFDQRFSPETMQGMILEIKLGKDGTILVKKNTVKLNSVFQPDKIIPGKEEKILSR